MRKVCAVRGPKPIRPDGRMLPVEGVPGDGGVAGSSRLLASDGEIAVAGRFDSGIPGIARHHDDELADAYLDRAPRVAEEPAPVNAISACFLDTSALYALFDRAQEENGKVTSAWGELVRSDAPLVTSNYILVELTALLQRRLGLDAVAALADFVLPFLDVIWIDQETHGRAHAILQSARRRDLSLVDGSSFVLMRGRGIRRAFALDGHFAEQGFDCLPA